MTQNSTNFFVQRIYFIELQKIFIFLLNGFVCINNILYFYRWAYAKCPQSFSWNKFIFKWWATWTSRIKVFPVWDRIPALAPVAGSCFMSAKMRLWSATIKLSSKELDYLHRSVFSPFCMHYFSGSIPVCLYSLGTIGLESSSKGFCFLRHSLPECYHPLGDFCLSICVLRRKRTDRKIWAVCRICRLKN